VYHGTNQGEISWEDNKSEIFNTEITLIVHYAVTHFNDFILVSNMYHLIITERTGQQVA